MWYVLHVLTGQELDVAQHLKSEGLHTAVPMEGRVIRTHGKWKEVEHILLPGYVFVEVAMDDSIYYLLNKTPGVIRILSTDKRPSPLSLPEVEWLLCLNSCLQELPTIEYLDHHTYRIVSGAIKCRAHCIEKLDRHRRRILIKLSILGETRRLELSYRIASSQNL